MSYAELVATGVAHACEQAINAMPASVGDDHARERLLMLLQLADAAERNSVVGLPTTVAVTVEDFHLIGAHYRPTFQSQDDRERERPGFQRAVG